MIPLRHRRPLALSLLLWTGLLADASASAGASGPTTGRPDEPDRRLLFIEADHDHGFGFPYYLFIPKSVGTGNGESPYLLVEPNNTGTVSDDFARHKDSARLLAERSHASRIAERLGSPLLVPVFPRPMTGWQRYTHALDRDTMLIDKGPLRRIDEQLISMIRHAHGVLRAREITCRPRVFMHGYSASGNFSNRFAALHPGLVKAVASGGVNATPIIPAAEWNGRRLPYPVGIADLETISGAAFDADAYRRVAQYVYMGYLDRNDTVPSRDAWDEDEAELIRNTLGDPMMPDRWTNVQTILGELQSPAQCVTYNGVGHAIKDEMLFDIVRFFRANAGDDVVHIDPYEYPFVAFRRIETAHVNGLLWPGDERIPAHWREPGRLSERITFLISITDWLDGQDHEQLSDFRRNAGFRFAVQADGQTTVQIDDHHFGGTVSMGDGRFQAFLVSLDDAEIDALTPGVPYALVPANANEGYSWAIGDGVTLVRPETRDE